MKQKLFKLEEQQRRDGEVLRRLEQIPQGKSRYEEVEQRGDVEAGMDSRVVERLSALEDEVFGR